jgi:GxxExxY protein
MSRPPPIPAETEKHAAAIVDSALRVHSALGPGLLESVYETCLAHELTKRGLLIRRQVIMPVVYDGVEIESGLQLDLLVGDAVVVEVKTVEKLIPLFEAQILTYLKMARLRLGLLINFNVPLIRDGIRRFAL